MEIRVILRGALSGFVAGVLGFIFARIFAEPVINKAIAYESGRDSILAALNRAAGRPVAPDGPEIFSRTIQGQFPGYRAEARDVGPARRRGHGLPFSSGPLRTRAVASPARGHHPGPSIHSPGGVAACVGGSHRCDVAGALVRGAVGNVRR